MASSKPHKVIGAFVLCCSIIGMPYFFMQASTYFETYIYYSKSHNLSPFSAICFLAHSVTFIIVKMLFRNYFATFSIKSKYFIATVVISISYYMQKYFWNPIIFASVTGIATGLNSGILLAHNISNIVQKFESKYKAVIIGVGLMASAFAPVILKMVFSYMANPNKINPTNVDGFILYPEAMVNDIINSIDLIFLIGICMYFFAYLLTSEEEESDKQAKVLANFITQIISTPKGKLSLQYSVPVFLHIISLMLCDLLANSLGSYGFALIYDESFIAKVSPIILIGSGIMAFISSLCSIYAKEVAAIKFTLLINVYLLLDNIMRLLIAP